MEFKVGHANVHNSPVGIRLMLRQGCASVGFNEVYRRTALLAGLERYRLVYGKGDRDLRRGAKSTVVAVRNHVTSLGELAIQGSEQVQPERIAPERWISVAMYAKGSARIAHVEIHANAVVKNLTTQVPRVREYDEYMGTLDHVLTFLAIEGFRVVISGDGNFPEKATSPGWTDVFEVLSSHRFQWETHRIDVMAWQPRRLELHQMKVIPAQRLHSDHAGLVGTFSPR